VKILGIEYQLGSIKIDNATLMDHIKRDTKGINARAIIKTIDYFLEKSRARCRYWVEEKEKPIDMVSNCIQRLLDRSGVKKEEINVIFHTGLYSGFVEPSQAIMIAHIMGMNPQRCHDVKDACNSWIAALEWANRIIDDYPYILLVNTECFFERYRPKFFQIEHINELNYKFAGFTNGDAVTATLLCADNNKKKFNFQFNTLPEAAELCTIPNEYWELFFKPSKKIAPLGKTGELSAFMIEMKDVGEIPLIEFLNKSLTNFQSKKYTRVVTHGHAHHFWINVIKKIGLDLDIWYNVFQDYGNLAAACLPVGLANTFETGLKRGEKVILAAAASGLSFAAADFEY
jgi:3-oxoacyl-[acyl-carrier-protein] synthase-3